MGEKMMKVVKVEMSLKEEDVVKRYLPAISGWELTTGSVIKIDVEGEKCSLFISFFSDQTSWRTGVFSWESGALISDRTYKSPKEQSDDVDDIINSTVIKVLSMTGCNFEILALDEKLNLQRVESKIGKKPDTSEYEVAEGLH